MRVWPFLLLLALVLFPACDGNGSRDEGDAAPPEQTAPGRDGAEGALDFASVETVAGGLEVPWSLAFVDEHTILVTERPGRVRLVQDGQLRPEPLLAIAVDDDGEGGLLGIALDPTFRENRLA
ncbi:MAG TPA: PQQ-dependent sugar dehydrogenase, partial [Gaiellaceae bacterium]|nr:PQQ-dependent sugar dehydrogenase [Gaiellaceae bacterium]